MIPFLVRRSRWMVFGWAARRVGKAGLSKSIDAATYEIEQRLPAPLAKTLDKLPGDVARAGGSLVVAGSSAKSVGGAVRSASESALNLNRRFKSVSISRHVASLRDEIAIESEASRRRIRSDMLRETDGDAAALDALLDLRPPEQMPLPAVPDPIKPGRRRHKPKLVAAPVARVKRSYQQAVKPWDRPSRTA